MRAVSPAPASAETVCWSRHRGQPSNRAPSCWRKSAGAQATPCSMIVVAVGSMRSRRSPTTPNRDVKAMPMSTQNTSQDGDAPIPTSANAGNRATGTPFVRITPA